MFGWFAAKCPLGTWEKTWTETRMRGLADQFGIDRLLRAEVVLPTEEFFPDPYAGTPEDARRLLERLCGHMEIDPAKVELEVCADDQMPGAAGHYDAADGRTVIRVAESQLDDAQSLVATLAHELAHELLLGGGLLTPEVEDHEWVTDLLPAYLGLGVFAANATLREAGGHDGNWSWWTMNRHGYLPSRVFGYAFALFAFLRDENDPEWTDYLRLDAASALRDGLRYLRKTGDSLFHPDTVRAPHRPPSAAEAVGRLREGTPSARLGALWDVREHPLPDPEVVAAVVACLDDRDEALPGEAARTLAALGPAGAAGVPRLIRALASGGERTRAGAAYALGVFAEQPEAVVPELSVLLEDPRPAVLLAAAEALTHFGFRAESAAARLLDALTRSLVECEHARSERLAAALLAVAPDPKRLIRQHFSANDADLRRLAWEAVKEQAAQTGREAPP